MAVRILHLIKGLGRGGAETLLAEGLRFADRSRFQYSYGYFVPWKDHLVEELERQGAPVRCFRATNSAALFWKTRDVVRYVREGKLELIHAHLPLSGVAARIVGRRTGVPVVYTEHNLLERYHPVTRMANLATWGWQERAFAVSEEVAASIAGRLGNGAGSRIPVHVVPNGVDTDKFRRNGDQGRALRRSLGIPEEAPVVGTVAVFRRQKRLDLWLQAARKLLDDDPGVHFLLVGAGPEMDQVTALAARLGLKERLHLPGLQADVRPHLSAMDVFLVSSRFEGLPLAILEAMAMECAVVSTDVGGIPEMLDGESGVLVPFREDDAEDLAREVGRILKSPSPRKALGAAARARVVASSSMRRMQEHLEALYLEVLEGGKSREA